MNDSSVPAWRVSGAMYLLLTAFLGRLPQAMGTLALVSFIRDGGGSYNLAGIATATFILGGALGQPFWGRVVDRRGPRAAVCLVSISGGIGLCCVAFFGVEHGMLLVGATTVAGLATPPLESCLRSTWPLLMKPGRQLNQAFSLDVAAQQFLFVLAPMINAVTLSVIGPSNNILLMAALTTIGSIAFSMSPVMRRVAAGHATQAAVSPLSYPVLRRIIGTQFLFGLPVGALPVLVNTFGELKESAILPGVLLGINGVGGFLGTIWMSRWKFERPITVTLRWTIICFGASFVLLVSVQVSEIYYAVAVFLAGIGFPMALAQIFHLIERSVPREVLNEANAWAVSGVGTGIAMGTWGCGLALGVAGPVAGSVMTVLSCACLTWASLIIVPRSMNDTGFTRTNSSHIRG